MRTIILGGLLLTVVSFMTGCSTCGPFVTNITPDGKGNLIVEKAILEFNSFTGNLTTKDHTSTTIRIVPESK